MLFKPSQTKQVSLFHGLHLYRRAAPLLLATISTGTTLPELLLTHELERPILKLLRSLQLVLQQIVTIRLQFLQSI